MESSLSGDRASVGLECADLTLVGRATYGRCGLWLGGYQLADAEAQQVCLDAVLASMRGIIAAEVAPAEPASVPASPEEMLDLMQGQPGFQHRYFLAIDGFDDFLKLFLRHQDEVLFHWAVHPQVAGLALYREYPKGVQQVTVKTMDLQKVVDQFAATVHATKP